MRSGSLSERALTYLCQIYSTSCLLRIRRYRLLILGSLVSPRVLFFRIPAVRWEFNRAGTMASSYYPLKTGDEEGGGWHACLSQSPIYAKNRNTKGEFSGVYYYHGSSP